jgi:hypothetical protein
MFTKRFLIGLFAIVATGAVIVGSAVSNAENSDHHDRAQHMHDSQTAIPTMPGQEVFGTIQEIVRILESDPTTDWSRVNIAALREHLIDMDEVTMRAAADVRNLDNSVEIRVRGEGRTLDAIKRMVPAHAHELEALGWNAHAKITTNGVTLVVTSNDPQELIKIKALGFIGIMVQGAHHQVHHLMMAKGEHVHG